MNLLNRNSSFVTRTSTTITDSQRYMLEKEYRKLPEGSIHMKVTRGHWNFYHYIRGHSSSINRNTNLIYKLARKKYISLVLNNDSFKPILGYLEKCNGAGLSLDRITLTPAQYKWVSSDYPTNPNFKDNLKYSTPSGKTMRSKSERGIGVELEFYSVPYRYEMTVKVFVGNIVKGLDDYLRKQINQNQVDKSFSTDKRLFNYMNGVCVWNVPDELSWMNAPGSIWRTYDQRTETIIVSIDFAILLGDGSILFWEHAGLCLNPIYRNNISERIFVLRASGFADDDHLLFTVEEDIQDINGIRKIIEEKILPRL